MIYIEIPFYQIKKFFFFFKLWHNSCLVNLFKEIFSLFVLNIFYYIDLERNIY
jgi:hypothetical protein